jgi:hypothetical protein
MFRFILGAIVGGIVVWLWRDEMVEYVDQRTREVRSKAADRLRLVQEKAESAFDTAKQRISSGLETGQEAIRPSDSVGSSG